jgi:hypothetical protein
MSQPPYDPPGSGDDTPQYNPNTGLPENPGPETQQYGSDPYAGGQYGSQPTSAYGSDQYGGGQYGAPADPYGSSRRPVRRRPVRLAARPVRR